MNINKYTEKAQKRSPRRIELAEQANNPQIEPEHLLVALVEQRDGIVPEPAAQDERRSGGDRAAAARELLAKLPRALRRRRSPALSPRFKLVTDQAQAEAERLKDEFVSTEHLFVAHRRRERPLAGGAAAASSAASPATRSSRR